MNILDKQTINLTKDRWTKHIKGFSFVDCCIWDRQQLVLIGKEDVPDEEYDILKEGSRKTRVITLLLSKDETKIANFQVGGFRFPKVAIERIHNPIILMSSRENEGGVFSANIDRSHGLEEITPEGDKHPKGSAYVYKLKCISGTVYAASFGRIIHKRIAQGQWIPLTNGLIWPEKMDSSDMGFQDIHGPNENNIYAVGGCGDVWHYNGEKWQWCDFPSNEQLSCVLVAPDGDVYISGEGGNLWRGQMHTWEKIHTGSSSVLNKDLVWYNNQVWASSDYQLRVWNGKELVRPVHDGKEIIMSGNMDVYENLLLVADLNTVKLFDGTDWHTIVRPHE